MNERVWLISDTHFGHKNLVEKNYCGRPFKTVEENDQTLIKNWNAVVKKTDLVYHLGDFSFCSKERIKELTTTLNGRKFLICGNHDTLKSSEYMELGFEWASRFPIIYAGFYIFSHEPVFLESNSSFGCCYGHLHQNKYVGKNNNYFNCCVEQTNYSPILFTDIQKEIECRTQ